MAEANGLLSKLPPGVAKSYSTKNSEEPISAFRDRLFPMENCVPLLVTHRMPSMLLQFLRRLAEIEKASAHGESHRSQ